MQIPNQNKKMSRPQVLLLLPVPLLKRRTAITLLVPLLLMELPRRIPHHQHQEQEQVRPNSIRMCKKDRLPIPS